MGLIADNINGPLCNFKGGGATPHPPHNFKPLRILVLAILGPRTSLASVARQILCAGTVNGDTYPSKRYAKHSLAS